jgi:ABC-type multidrug transport system fused ATPase/permease subunit
LGYKQQELSHDDLPVLSRVDGAGEISLSFDYNWRQRLRKNPVTMWGLFGVLHASFWRTFYLSAALIFVSTVIGLCVPVLLRHLLDKIDKLVLQHSAADVDEGTLVEAYVLAIALFLCTLAQALLEHQFWVMGVRCCLHTKAALMHKVCVERM